MSQFRMSIEDVSWPPDKEGPVVVGSTDQGVLRVGETLNLLTEDSNVRSVTLRGIEGALPLEPGRSKMTRLHLLIGDELTPDDVLVGQILLTASAPEDDAGVREPRRPSPPTQPDAAEALSLIIG